MSGLVKKYQVPVELLRLEITESAFSHDTAKIVDVVKKLIDLGFTVEIDDFGSGYSSLNTLKDVPAQIIKLDMKFMESSELSSRGGNIVESMVRMAKWLGLTVIAEGVETVQQADFLKSIGCFYIQGYLYSKPIPVADYEKLGAVSRKQLEAPRLEMVKHMDNNTFWDPDSMDSLIFNSYIGGACIMEYDGTRIELLRANEKYIQVIGSAGMTIEDALKLNWVEHIDRTSLENMNAVINRVSLSGEEATGEYIFIDLPGCPGKTYLRSTLRVIARIGDRRLIYITNENITAQRVAEETRNEKTELLSFLESVAHELLAQTNVDEGIMTLLDKVRRYFDGERCYVFEFDRKRGVAICTYELCNYGKASSKEHLQDVPLQKLSYWLDAFDRRESVSIEDVSALPDSRPERELLQKEGVKDLVAVPLFRMGVLNGFIGIDDPKQKQNQIESLSSIGDYAAVLLSRRDMNEAINSENQEKIAVMDGIPGGFVRMMVRPDGSVISLYHSRGYQRMVNMSAEELREIYGKNSFAGVHLDDIDIVRNALHMMLTDGEANNVCYRLRRGGGGYTKVKIFGKMRKSRSGETYLNVYYNDATEEDE